MRNKGRSCLNAAGMWFARNEILFESCFIFPIFDWTRFGIRVQNLGCGVYGLRISC